MRSDHARRTPSRPAAVRAHQLTRLQATVTTDNPWGDDEPGSAFGMVYTAALGHALEAMGSHLMAGTEQTVTARIGSVGRGL